MRTLALLTRKGLINADRNFSPCDVCDVSGDLIGKKHAEKWKDYFDKENEKI